MTQTMTLQDKKRIVNRTLKKSGYVVHRKVRRMLSSDEAARAGAVIFVTKSFSDARPDAPKYHPVICTDTGSVRCDCPDFTYRHAVHNPTVLTSEHFCKHIWRAVSNLNRSGEMAAILDAAVGVEEIYDEWAGQPVNYDEWEKYMAQCPADDFIADGGARDREMRDAENFCPDCGTLFEEIAVPIAPYDYKREWGCPCCEAAREGVMCQ